MSSNSVEGSQAHSSCENPMIIQPSRIGRFPEYPIRMITMMMIAVHIAMNTFVVGFLFWLLSK